MEATIELNVYYFRKEPLRSMLGEEDTSSYTKSTSTLFESLSKSKVNGEHD